ncbi:bifunctional folylpolyglutamate synthase/dihydrofolate synthase [bacterium D16-54]|nr:bifunctional folylpolyglutamate synthase/dihydrofolate synthase [bacterium D16-54]RKJ12095.1 bifunctional folylpolyglutamate synthase/dihydrofolate synthase [bacterium D16-56]
MDEQAKEYLLKIPFWTKKKNSLEQVRDFLVELGDPEKGFSIIHVAGTNGKGSVCADLTAILKEAGYKVGTFISPHLSDIRERFLINGELADRMLFEDCFRQVLAAAERMKERGYFHPTFFEFVFLIAMVMFAREKVDYVILETGLGGRLDTTNVIRRPKACVITSISLDHTQYLGETIPEIAAEKAGIIKPGVPVIYDDGDPAASKVICRQARIAGAPAWPVGQEDEAEEDQKLFAAPYQARNAALARKVFKVLEIPGIDENVCRAGIRKVSWPGRMEKAAPDVWLDGAHNPGGIRAFIQAVKEQTKKEFRQIHLLFAAVEDKDYREMIQMLCNQLPITRVTVVHLKDERGAAQELLADQFRQAGCMQVKAYKTAAKALEAALSHRKEGDRLYVVGSLYLIGEIRELMWGGPAEIGMGKEE